MRLSASRMQVWMDCPKKAQFRYIDKLPEPQSAAASFGTVVHHALDVYNQTQDIDKAVATFIHCWEHPETLGVTPEIWPKYTNFDRYRSRGLDAIRAYHDQTKWANRTVLATEHGFLVPFGKHELTGYVDCVEVSGSKTGQALKIVDFKTAGKVPFVGNLRQNCQMSVYAYASRQPEFWLGNGPDFPPMVNGAYWMEMTKDLPRKNIWYAVMRTKEVDAGERTMADFMRLYRVADEIERALDAKVFVPNISGDSCGFCPYTTPCGLAIPPSMVIED